jgi:hypothetical protein
MEKNGNSPTFHAKITPAQVLARIAEDKKAKEPKISKVSEKSPQVDPGHVSAEDPEAEEPKKAPKKEPTVKGKKAELTFPATIRINAYGFIGLRKPLLTALGWKKDMALSVVKNPDGSVTVRKA